MDGFGIIHRVLENKEALLNLHSVDRAQFDFTYINFIFKTTSHNIHSPHNNDISLFYGVGVNNVIFDTVKINLMYSNDIGWI